MKYFNLSIDGFPMSLERKTYQKLLPPLVDKIRKEVKLFRDSGYKGASKTSRNLLKYWFQTDKNINGQDFKYYLHKENS